MCHEWWAWDVFIKWKVFCIYNRLELPPNLWLFKPHWKLLDDDDNDDEPLYLIRDIIKSILSEVYIKKFST